MAVSEEPVVSEKRRKISSNGRGAGRSIGFRRRRAPSPISSFFSSPFIEIFLFSSSLFLSGCGYGLVGTGSSAIPATVKTVYVPTFINETTVVSLEQDLTDAVIRELSARGRLKPVKDRTTADAELSGRLTGCNVSPVRFDANGIAVEYQVTVSAKIALIERSTEKPIFAEPAYLFRQPYTVPSAASAYYDREREAIQAMARPFAQNLVTTILEGF